MAMHMAVTRRAVLEFFLKIAQRNFRKPPTPRVHPTKDPRFAVVYHKNICLEYGQFKCWSGLRIFRAY